MADGVRPRAIPVKEMNPGRGQVFGHELVGGGCQTNHVGGEKGGDDRDGNHYGVEKFVRHVQGHT